MPISLMYPRAESSERLLEESMHCSYFSPPTQPTSCITIQPPPPPPPPPPLSASLFAFTWTLHGKHSSSAVRSHECLVPLVSGVKHFARFKLSDFLHTDFVLDCRGLITIFLNSQLKLKELNRWPPYVILWDPPKGQNNPGPFLLSLAKVILPGIGSILGFWWILWEVKWLSQIPCLWFGGQVLSFFSWCQKLWK